ncbi:hypothetical protein [Burkholderia pseudomallei]|uniref:hypothetical protein n=1 Tax=Burkholderia pseudomallei TaxID=28450 RepID=UPI000538264E|nr:hypothetical protein [Burkholderia pseudomallei]KGW98955.1 hypothetical protein Y034_6095 [Burkholderia pseudomallei MSHR449]OMZ99117.1 hypothetical protein AQ875_07710 [Burkholderia pseudomallei]ONC01008.1 hypothetical protein AQ910_15820 [Burkholderia pseudomallei]ONC37969.1 hypothetical protein AQ916_08520 [Burkholderia pseudomallei]ONF35430.1 hypothetical protein AQ964_15060 [Burkholderia pseudomallei]
MKARVAARFERTGAASVRRRWIRPTMRHTAASGAVGNASPAPAFPAAQARAGIAPARRAAAAAAARRIAHVEARAPRREPRRHAHVAPPHRLSDAFADTTAPIARGAIARGAKREKPRDRSRGKIRLHPRATSRWRAAH